MPEKITRLSDKINKATNESEKKELGSKVFYILQIKGQLSRQTLRGMLDSDSEAAGHRVSGGSVSPMRLT